MVVVAAVVRQMELPFISFKVTLTQLCDAIIADLPSLLGNSSRWLTQG
jgi:hypothetical protein